MLYCIQHCDTWQSLPGKKCPPSAVSTHRMLLGLYGNPVAILARPFERALRLALLLFPQPLEEQLDGLAKHK
jgi:hypothetical protein